MFPTRAKDKIPRTLCYPLKAKAISEALVDVPQADELKLWFSSHGTPAKLRLATEFRLIQIWYHFWEANRFMPRKPNESRGEWVIEVHAVPVEIRARVTQLLHDEALPKLATWLHSKTDVSGFRSCRVEVSYHEAEDKLSCFKRET